jgi:hypothetical protein
VWRFVPSPRDTRLAVNNLFGYEKFWLQGDGMRSLLIGTALTLGTFASPVCADWWIVRSSDETCLVVDIEPTGNEKGVTKIGKDVYPTAEQAEADAKRLCKESKAETKR